MSSKENKPAYSLDAIMQAPLPSDKIPFEDSFDFDKMIKGEVDLKDIFGVLNPPRLGAAPEPVDVSENRKVRNACLTGHVVGGEKKCPRCLEARFNRLTSGNYAVAPTLDQFRQTVRRYTSGDEFRSDDYRFILDYVGLPAEANGETLQRFYRKVHKIEVMSRWARGRHTSQWAMHPLTRKAVPLVAPFEGKSGLMASIIERDVELREIYAEAIVLDTEVPFAYDYKGLDQSNARRPVMVALDTETYDLSLINRMLDHQLRPTVILGKFHAGKINRDGKLADATKSLREVMHITELRVSCTNDPFDNRAARRKKKNATPKLYVTKNVAGPVKHGDHNTTQLVKDVKPHPLLKNLIKKTEK